MQHVTWLVTFFNRVNLNFPVGGHNVQFCSVKHQVFTTLSLSANFYGILPIFYLTSPTLFCRRCAPHYFYCVSCSRWRYPHWLKRMLPALLKGSFSTPQTNNPSKPPPFPCTRSQTLHSSTTPLPTKKGSFKSRGCQSVKDSN